MTDTIEIEDTNGNRITVPLAHWNRYPQLAETFRPTPKKAAPVIIDTPHTPIEKNFTPVD